MLGMPPGLPVGSPTQNRKPGKQDDMAELEPLKTDYSFKLGQFLHQKAELNLQMYTLGIKLSQSGVAVDLLTMDHRALTEPRG